MAKAASPVSIFADVLSNSQDISNKYYDDSALRRDLSDDPASFKDLLRFTREQMQANGGIRRISAVASSLIDKVNSDHIAGKIAAVDGTDAISPTEVMSKTVYAAGVISTTAQTLHDPRISMTESHRKIPKLAKDDDFFAFIDKLNAWVDEDLSWIRTFREYCERNEALRLIDDDNVGLVLIDGPLYTQNLLTQKVAHRILDEMQDRCAQLIGFIKNLHSSKVMHLSGMALEPDEFWTLNSWRRNVLTARFSRHPDALGWVNRAADWGRTIYRKNDKAFAFECHPDLTDIGIALIASPVTCAAIINHEIPFLLHSADRIVQARVAAAAKSDNLINTLPFYANLAGERSFR